MGVRGIDHVNLRAPADLVERLRRFYTDLIGLREGPRPTPRSGSRGHWLYAGERAVGRITSAVVSPRLGSVIALGYAHRDFTEPGTPLEVDADGERHAATVHALPFVPVQP